MTSATRAQLLRERFRAKYPSTYSTRPKPKVRRPKTEKKTYKPGVVDSWFGTAAVWNQGKTEWVQLPEKQVEKPEVEPKRRRSGPIPLVVIAQKLERGKIVWEKYPRRLPKR